MVLRDVIPTGYSEPVTHFVTASNYYKLNSGLTNSNLEYPLGFVMITSQFSGITPNFSSSIALPAVSSLQRNLFSILFPGGSEGKESACNAGDPGSISGLGRSPGEGNGNPLQYSCLENPMNERAWRAAVHAATKSWTRLSD